VNCVTNGNQRMLIFMIFYPQIGSWLCTILSVFYGFVQQKASCHIAVFWVVYVSCESNIIQFRCHQRNLYNYSLFTVLLCGRKYLRRGEKAISVSGSVVGEFNDVTGAPILLGGAFPCVVLLCIIAGLCECISSSRVSA